jgi:hypothetical protein
MLVASYVLPVLRSPFNNIKFPLVIGLKRSILMWPLVNCSEFSSLANEALGMRAVISTFIASLFELVVFIVLNYPQESFILC